MLSRLIAKYLTGPLALKYAGSLIRHGLTFLAGLLVSYGAIKGSPDAWISSNYDVVMGLVAYALSQYLSFAEKASK